MAKGRTRVKTLYATSQLQLAHVLAVSPNDLSDWINNDDDAPKKTASGFDVRAWSLYIRARRGGATAESAAEAIRRSKVVRAELDELTLQERRGKLIERVVADANQVVVTKLFVGILERAGSELPALLWGKKKTRGSMGTAIRSWCNARREELASDDS